MRIYKILIYSPRTKQHTCLCDTYGGRRMSSKLGETRTCSSYSETSKQYELPPRRESRRLGWHRPTPYAGTDNYKEWAQFSSSFFSLLEGLERNLALLLRRLERRVGPVQVVAVRLQAPVAEMSLIQRPSGCWTNVHITITDTHSGHSFCFYSRSC